MASRVMRRLLVDYARARSAARRGGGAVAVELHEDLVNAGPSLVPPAPENAAGAPAARAAGVRARQEHYLARDVIQLDHRDVRAANTLVEDDILRAFQRAPGVASRDDHAAGLWTRGASAGQTVIRFDGVPLVGGLHALGVLGGLSSDMLATATLQPGAAGAATQGGGAAVIGVVSRGSRAS